MTSAEFIEGTLQVDGALSDWLPSIGKAAMMTFPDRPESVECMIVSVSEHDGGVLLHIAGTGSLPAG